MSVMVNVHEAKTQLSKLLARASINKEVIIARAGVPIVRLVAIQNQSKRRTPGSAKGRIWMSPDFDAPLPPEILDAF